MIPIADFQYICDLAKCSKCQMFVLLQNTNKLYGGSDECCAIHEIDVPFLVNTDLIFRLDCIDSNILQSYKSFFVPEKFDWVILPDYYWEMYVAGDLISEYDYSMDQYMILDSTTKQPIPQIQMLKYRACNDIGSVTLLKQLEGFLNTSSHLAPPDTFYDFQSNEAIRKAYDSKAATGRVLCQIKSNNTNVLFYFYKGLFSLNKSDTLSLDIRFDLFNKNLFMATFIPKKKKNPLTFNTYGVPFQERIHCMFVNMI